MNQDTPQKKSWFRSIGLPLLVIGIGGVITIALTLAARTRAAQAELFQRQKALGAIVPFDGEFLADDLHVQGLHGHSLPAAGRAVHDFLQTASPGDCGVPVSTGAA